MQDDEKKGSFYLGRIIEKATGKAGNLRLLYDSKDLTTHAVCVGMTGSGKTGLGISLLEEAGLNQLPAIIIDPKGDLTNLLLTFPDLSPEEFRPWIDESEASRKGLTPENYAESIAKTWKEGLAASGEDSDRIKKLRNSVEMDIYTPGSQLGTPISVLNSFSAPSKEQLLDTGATRDKVQSLTSSLLGLLGINADPIKSREHILLSTLIDQAWEKGIDLDIALLIQQVQKPPFAKIGALPIDTFYPPKERLELSVSLNNLLASPGFQVWMEGAPLDINQLLFTKEGKPKLSILSIMHLSDSERMFFVTLLLNEFLTWMRQQSGTSNLRALLYMDEIFGFFPPSAMPPSKLPMLTLLKQARAFGVGIVLVTQNPVDLDYKGLSNCGTWFIGKLQTERDKARVIEGLKIASNGEVDAKKLDQLLAATGNRTFILRSIYKEEPILFQTRWTLSFLRGPLTLTQIAKLTDRPSEVVEKRSQPSKPEESNSTIKPNGAPGISEFFIHPENNREPVNYQPRVLGVAKLHFVDAKSKIDAWQEFFYIFPAIEEGNAVDWEKGENIPNLKERLATQPLPGSTFEELPPGLMQPKNYALFEKKFAADLYQNQTSTLYRLANPPMLSNLGESEESFRARAAQVTAEKSQELIKKLNDQYEEKMILLRTKVKRFQDKMEQKQEKAWTQKIETAFSFLMTIIGAFFGKRLTKATVSQTGTSLRRVGQISRDSQEAAQAEEAFNTYQQQLEDLEKQRESEIASLHSGETGEALSLETLVIHPRKSDITVDKMALLWRPKE